MNDTYVLRGRVATMAKPGEHLDSCAGRDQRRPHRPRRQARRPAAGRLRRRAGGRHQGHDLPRPDRPPQPLRLQHPPAVAAAQALRQPRPVGHAALLGRGLEAGQGDRRLVQDRPLAGPLRRGQGGDRRLDHGPGDQDADPRRLQALRRDHAQRRAVGRPAAAGGDHPRARPEAAQGRRRAGVRVVPQDARAAGLLLPPGRGHRRREPGALRGPAEARPDHAQPGRGPRAGADRRRPQAARRQGRQGRVVAVQQPAAVRPHARPEGARRLEGGVLDRLRLGPDREQEPAAGAEGRPARGRGPERGPHQRGPRARGHRHGGVADGLGAAARADRRRRAGRPAGHRRARRRPVGPPGGGDRGRRRPRRGRRHPALRLEDADAAPARGRRPAARVSDDRTAPPRRSTSPRRTRRSATSPTARRSSA